MGKAKISIEIFFLQGLHYHLCIQFGWVTLIIFQVGWLSYLFKVTFSKLPFQQQTPHKATSCLLCFTVSLLLQICASYKEGTQRKLYTILVIKKKMFSTLQVFSNSVIFSSKVTKQQSIKHIFHKQIFLTEHEDLILMY